MTDMDIHWLRTNFTDEDIEKVGESIRNKYIIIGRITEQLEQRLAEALEVPYDVATTRGSIAILLALMALGIETVDEVIIPNRTWITTAHAPMMLRGG